MRYFTPEEFWCKCGRADCPAQRNIHPVLAVQLDAMRELYGGPLTVTSGIRCVVANAKAGGVPDSEHLTGEGADLACPSSAHRYAMLRAADKAGFRRIGIGKTFVHVGVSRSHDQDVIWLYP